MLVKCVRPLKESFFGLETKYRGSVSNVPWTLCIGAGTSTGLVPNWSELTWHVLQDAFKTKIAFDEFKKACVNTGWGLDAYIQAAENIIDSSSTDARKFISILGSALYNDLFKKATTYNVTKELIIALSDPRYLKLRQMEKLYVFLEKEFKQTTIFSLSRILNDLVDTPKAPTAVLSFNADTLLYTITDVLAINEHETKIGQHVRPKRKYQSVFRSQYVWHGSIPFIYSHGAIAPNVKVALKEHRRDSRDKLVFREKDYLDIAGNMSSWTQSTFLYYAQTTRMLIIGHSLSDLNIRKWLAWTHKNNINDIDVISGGAKIPAYHVWVNVLPKEKWLRDIMECGLHHLGVAVCWIKDWDEIDSALRNVLAI